MKVVCIFAKRLYAIQYDDQKDNEYDRLIELWTDVEYLSGFAKENNEQDIKTFVKQILRDAEQIQDYLDGLDLENSNFSFYFQPLKLDESYKVLSLQKGKIIQNRLRIYAIKIDENCYLITGGAIKMSQTMQNHPDTAKELPKLAEVRSYLKNNDIIDDSSFYELINEQS